MTNRLEYLLEEYEQRQHNLSTTNSQTPTPSNLYRVGRCTIVSLHISMVDVANISMVDVGGFV